VRERSGAQSSIGFQEASGFDEAFRKVNPLGKVPALIMSDGTALLETTLIVRTIMEFGSTSLWPVEPDDRRQAEADVALCMGILDLGVAFFLESKRDASEQSAHWQERRLTGLSTALPTFDDAAVRAVKAPAGAAALAVYCTADWLQFRLADHVDWPGACPAVGALVRDLGQLEDIAATDPRLA